MIGLPDETEKDIEDTLKFSRKVGLNYSQYSILVPYPFTNVYTVITSYSIHYTKLYEEQEYDQGVLKSTRGACSPFYFKDIWNGW